MLKYINTVLFVIYKKNIGAKQANKPNSIIDYYKIIYTFETLDHVPIQDNFSLFIIPKQYILVY